MAMTFTIASAAREALTALIADRLKREKDEDDRKTREYEEVSRLRTPIPNTELEYDDTDNRPRRHGQGEHL